MKKNITLAMVLSSFILILKCYGTDPGEKAVTLKIQEHLTWAKNKNGITCMGQGMGSPKGKIENISLFLTRPGPHTIGEARRLAVLGLEDLSCRLNQIDNGPDILTTFPCGADNLYYAIYFTDGKGNILNFTEHDSNISNVVITRSRIVYLSSAKPHGPSQIILTEKYEDALEVIQSATDSQPTSAK